MASDTIKVIHDALLTLHKQFDVLNKENERVQSVIDGMQEKLTELTKSTPAATPIIPHKKRIQRKKKKSEAIVQAPKSQSTGNGSTKPIPKTPLSDTEKEKISALAKQGVSGTRIAKTIGRSQTAVSMYIRQQKLNESRPESEL